MIYYYGGLVRKSDITQFKKLLFRISKGKVLCKVCDDASISYIRPTSFKTTTKPSSDKIPYILVFQDSIVLR
jgi:hypothetical protein